MVGEWEEREFEWIRPARFIVDRRFSKGPISRMIQSCELTARDGAGTTVVYEMRVTPVNLLGAIVVPLAVGVRMRRAVERVFRHYDRLAGAQTKQGDAAVLSAATKPADSRLARIAQKLVGNAGQPEALVRRLTHLVESGDDPSLAKMRPYAIADSWGTERGETLDLFLHATREGMLDFSLNEPPIERLPIPDFRTVDDAGVRSPSPDLLETVETMQRRQAWMHEYLAPKHPINDLHVPPTR